MNELIKIHTNENGQAVSARDLHNALGMQKDFSDWFKYQANKLGLIEGLDFTPILGSKTEGSGGHNKIDYIMSIDTAKHIAMMSGGENAHKIREYFIQVEKAWNSPEMVMARGLQMANKQIDGFKEKVTYLETENKLLAGETLQWTDRKILEAIVKKYGGKIGYAEAWREFKKELLYKHGINLNSRITNYMNTSGKKTAPKTLSMIHDDELPDCISTAVALCNRNNINISAIISKTA
jgi:phage anti-repressor protein